MWIIKNSLRHTAVGLLALFGLLVPCYERPCSAHAESADQATASPATQSRAELIKNALASVARIQREIAELRALPFLQSVAAEHQSQEDFRRYVEGEVDVDLPSPKSQTQSRAVHHIGLLKEKLDLASAIEDAVVSQAGAYYEPQTKKFYIVMVPNSEMLLNTISSHELTHALQDQHFDLTKYAGGRGNTQRLSEDVLNARRFIIEGDATLTMMAYQMRAMTKVNMLDPDRLEPMRAALNQAAKINFSQLKELQKQQSQMFVDMGEEIKEAINAIDKIPPYILVPLSDSYYKGALPVFEAYAKRGWTGVADLYKNPPDSTEQVLHPLEKLIGSRDYPTKLTLPVAGKLLESWKEIHADVLGELLWRVYFTIWGSNDPETVASGWDGDTYAVYTRGDRTVALIATTWDSPAEAARFADAYLATLRVRFPNGPSAQGKDYRGVSRPDRTLVVVEQQQKNVNIVDGCDESAAGALLALLRGAKAERHPADK